MLRKVQTVNTFTQRAFVRHLTGTENAQSTKPFRSIPGPSSLPILGQLHHFLPVIGIFHNIEVVDLTKHLYKTYGPIVKLEALGQPNIVTLSDPESCEQILRAENQMPKRPGFLSLEYYRKHHNKSKEESNLPTGLLTDHNEEWKSFRSKVNPVMMQPKTIKLYKSVIDEVSEEMVKRIHYLRDENTGDEINKCFLRELNKWALESIGVVAFGGRLGCLDPALRADSPANQLIDCVHELMRVTDELDFKPSLWRIFPTKSFKHGMEVYETQVKLSKLFIEHAKKELKSKSSNNQVQEVILEKLLRIDERTAVIMATDMLLAGVDTAANTIASTLYLLGTNKDKQARLREEIQKNKGSDSNPYLRACIKESLRMMPVVAGNIRALSKDYVILGYELPKNTWVSFSHQYMSMLESQYPRPEEYIPERWLVDKDDALYHGRAHRFAMAPFGFGVRMCIGRRIAELEIESFLTKAIDTFHVEWQGSPPKIKTTTLNYMQGPYNFVFNDV